MYKLLSRDDRIGWLTCALGTTLLAVLANLYIFVVKPFGSTFGIDIAQTGPVGALIAIIVPYVWLFLYAFMGSAFWLMVKGRERIPAQAWWVVVLLAICLGYPFYTGNFSVLSIALTANIVVVIVGGLGVWNLWPLSRPAALLLLPVIAWVSLASVGLLAIITGQRF